MATVSPRCVWALNNAGQIQTGGARGFSSIAEIVPSSMMISAGRSASSSPTRACPETIRGTFFHTAYLSFIYRKMKYICMAKKQGGRLLSSAGLVNYYDSEDRRAVHVSPIAVMVVAAIIGIIIMTVNILYPG